MTPSTIDPVPLSAYPSFKPVNGPPPAMPAAWAATVLLHPFSPPLSTDPKPDNPFFQLCTANVKYVAGSYLSAQVTGTDYGQWWYVITPDQTLLSTDGGRHWTPVNLGWTLPKDWYGAQADNAACAGSSPLNWMSPQPVDWWKVPVPIPQSPPAATWMWFDSSSSAPVRMMFGNGPPKPTLGDPTQLAFFQMWSFSYFPSFQSYASAEAAPPKPSTFEAAAIPGFAVGNPNGYELFTWNTNFGMTAFMTPVNGHFNPLPTRVLYVWKDDADYRVYSDRAQDTLMLFTYNPDDPQHTQSQTALLTGPAPAGTTPPPESATGFLITSFEGAPSTCLGGSQFPFPQEPPNWISIPGVEGTIQATISGNPVIAPNTTVTICSVLFPPAPPNYPEATYLWTWYAPQNASGTQSRPITFMQSQSGVNLGTSLALADYYFYENFSQPINPGNFDIPSVCSVQTRNFGLRRRLP